MAESTLALKLSDLQQETGFFLGFGRGADASGPAWSTKQTAAIRSCISSGLRNFYYPQPMDGMKETHEWSFLRPRATLTYDEDAVGINLPDDFGGVEGDVTVSVSGQNGYWPIKFMNEGQIANMYANFSLTGRPQACAVRWLKGTTVEEGQRAVLDIYPTADQAYTLTLQYYILPGYLTGDKPYAYGPASHAETILESCLAVAEQRINDTAAVHTMLFRQRLLASVQADKNSKAQTLGYNGDRSDIYDQGGVIWTPYPPGININGVPT